MYVYPTNKTKKCRLKKYKVTCFIKTLMFCNCFYFSFQNLFSRTNIKKKKTILFCLVNLEKKKKFQEQNKKNLSGLSSKKRFSRPKKKKKKSRLLL